MVSARAGSRGIHRRGVTLVETLAATIIVSLLTIATAGLMSVGRNQQANVGYYGNAQTDLRTAMHTITRTLRHGYSVKSVGTLGTLVGLQSNASQIICNIPQPSSGANVEVMFYVSGGKLYYQKSTDASPGTALITDETSLNIIYYTTTNGTTAVASAASLATEVQITLTVKYGTVSTSTTAYVELRN